MRIGNYRKREFSGHLSPGETSPDDTIKLYWQREIRGVLLNVNERCHDSLIKFSIDPPIGINKLRKPFSNVQHVCITNCSRFFSYKRGSLYANFLRLRCLNIRTNDNAMSMELKLLPNLQELTFVSHRHHSSYKELRVALRSNPQLRKFTATIHELDFTPFIKTIVPHFQSIQEFDLTYKPDILSYRHIQIAFYNEGEKIHLSNVRVFKLDLDIGYKERPFRQIPFKFDQLKSFSLKDDFLHDDSVFVTLQ